MPVRVKPGWILAALGLVFLLPTVLLIWLFWISYTVGVSERTALLVAVLASVGVALGVRGVGLLADRRLRGPDDPPAA